MKKEILKHKYFIAIAKSLVIVLFFSVNFSVAKAQCPAPPDCFSDPFVPGTPYVNTIIAPGCTVTVHWCWRVACGMYYDFVVTKIEYSSPLCYSSSVSPAAISKVAFIWAIEHINPWQANIPPCPGKLEGWRLGKLGCAAAYTDNRNWVVNIPCVPETRCWEKYNICWSSVINQVVNLELVDTFPTQSCELTSEPEVDPSWYRWPEGCQNICGE